MLKFLAITAIVTGCGTVPEPTDNSSSSRTPLVANAPAVNGVISGYTHSLKRSAFRPGNGSTVTTGGVTKFVGVDGVFATTAAGLVMAIPNSNAVSASRPALTSVGEEHNAYVRKYFVNCGMPADQISGASAHATMHAAVDPLNPDPKPTSHGTFDWYSSVLYRAIDGIPVPDSFAWARFNADGDVVAESVFWPDVPLSVLKEAQALKAKISADPSGFKAKLPAYLQASVADPAAQQKLSGGGVVIRHSSGEGNSAPTFHAVFDVTPSGNLQHVWHVDENGADVAF